MFHRAIHRATIIMKKAGLISLIVSLGAAAFQFSSCKEEKRSSMPEPSVRATLTDGKLHVQLQIPERHHAYLDGGREGNLIPVTFDWQGWASGPEQTPKTVQAPLGEEDADSGARILRGEGTFIFQAKETPAPADFRVRVQICDEVKGVCYRPAWYPVKPGA